MTAPTPEKSLVSPSPAKVEVRPLLTASDADKVNLGPEEELYDFEDDWCVEKDWMAATLDRSVCSVKESTDNNDKKGECYCQLHMK